MEIWDGDLGSKVVSLVKGDSLRGVPRSHRRLLTPEIEAWWIDPARVVSAIADSAPTENMGRWFRAMADGGQWTLQLTRLDKRAAQTSINFTHPGIRGAQIGPPAEREKRPLPPGLSDFYRLVGFVDWMGFGCSGGLNYTAWHMPLSSIDYEYHGAEVDLARTFIFGGSPGGDMLIYTTDGRGGWVCHENGKIHLLGTELDTIDWVFGELLANRCPDFDYVWS